MLSACRKSPLPNKPNLIIDDLILALINVLIAIASAIIEVMVHLGAALFGASYMAARHDGLMRIGFTILAAVAGYLLFGIARWLIPALATPGLTPLYSFWGFVIVLVLLGVGLFLVTVGAEHTPATEETTKPHAAGAPGWLIHLFSYGLAILLVLTLLSAGSSTAHRRSLTERACDAALQRIDQSTQDSIAQGLSLADRLLNRDISTRVPCQPQTE